MKVRVGDGRTLTVETWGAPNGAPIFLLHGTPGSRFGPRPRVSVLYRLGVRLIAYDRPGYGESDQLDGRDVAHAAADVATIADALELDRFAVVGRSGGGPHALACAVLLAERITRAAVLVGLAPRSAKGLDWYAGMSRSNVVEYQAAEAGRLVVAVRAEANAALIRRDPAAHLPFRDPDLPESDRRVVADVGIRSMFISNFAEAVKTSGLGWADDLFSFISDWGFDPSDTDVPILFWHGAQDVFSPVSHTLWLAERARRGSLVVESEAAHFGSMAALPHALAWVLVGRATGWPSAA